MELLFSDNLSAAFLAEIVNSFEKHHSRHFLGRTAMQKLAYFARATGVPIPCSFEIYNYGPYSDTITFTIESMLADDILKDVSKNNKYSDYRLRTHNINFTEEIKQTVKKYKDQIDEVVSVLGGFSPQKLELIATLHFIARRQMSIKGKISKKEVEHVFFEIKGDKFEKEEVSRWYDALTAAKIL